MIDQENKEQKVFEGNVILNGLLSMREDLCHGTKLNLFDVAKNFTQNKEAARKILQ
jgi:hypothetical protein